MRGVGAQLGHRLGDRRVDVRDRRRVLLGEEVPQGLVLLRVAGIVGDGGRCEPLRPVDGPAVAVRDEVERRLGHRLRPEHRLGDEHLLTRGVGDDLLRTVLVAVPGDDDVDPGHHAGDVPQRVLVQRGPVVALVGHGAVAGVGDHDDDVGLLGDDRHPLLRRLDEVAELQLSLDEGAVPHAHSGGHHPDDAHGHLLIADLPVDECVRLVVGLAGVDVDDIRSEQWEVDVALVGGEQRQVVVVLVVAHRLDVVAEIVEGGRHRVLDLAVQDGLGPVADAVVVGQRRALDGVAVVDEQDRLRALLGADLADDRREPGEAETAALGERLVAEVVPVVDVAVDVGRGEQRELEPLGVGGLGSGRYRGRQEEGRRGDGGQGSSGAHVDLPVVGGIGARGHRHRG